MAIVTTLAAPVISCRLSSLVKMSKMVVAGTSTLAFLVANCSELATTESVPMELFLMASPPITSLAFGSTTVGTGWVASDVLLRAGAAEKKKKGALTIRRRRPRAQIDHLATVFRRLIVVDPYLS